MLRYLQLVNIIWMVALAGGVHARPISSIGLFRGRGPLAPRRLPIQPGLPLTLKMRGGEMNTDEEESEDENDTAASDSDGELESRDEVVGDSNTVSSLVGTLVKTAFRTTKALIRATLAILDFSEVAEDASITDHLLQGIKRTWRAFFSTFQSTPAQSTPLSSASKKTIDEGQPAIKPRQRQQYDFGSQLASFYGVDSGRDVLDQVEPILTGSFQDALRDARRQARLLVAFIPAYLPKKDDTSDKATVESFLSQEVAMVAQKKAKKGATTGSFVLWSAKASSPEASLVLRRLKVQTTNAKGKKRPILAVVYPNQALDSSGRPKILPRLLAQHHCSPPPAAETMAAWLNAVRKRHLKLYGIMQTELRELELFHERKAGYKESVKADIENKQREEREEAERIARVEAEKKRAEELQQRRKTIEEKLPEEPEKSDQNARTVALRLADGRSAQRRFPSDASLETVFGWVDVVFEIEQETVTLTTMNGKLSFSWEDRETTLEESGLPKMAGLRVSVTKEGSENESESG